eukprot:GILJ01028210.1.p2 GENE.GILJ01028210.1~~GILJ01028210.1.p2  ORF type:complete len:186 (-),score=21.03 GILJ01028210.1:681-1238(-)
MMLLPQREQVIETLVAKGWRYSRPGRHSTLWSMMSKENVTVEWIRTVQSKWPWLCNDGCRWNDDIQPAGHLHLLRPHTKPASPVKKEGHQELLERILNDQDSEQYELLFNNNRNMTMEFGHHYPAIERRVLMEIESLSVNDTSLDRIQWFVTRYTKSSGLPWSWSNSLLPRDDLTFLLLFCLSAA